MKRTPHQIEDDSINVLALVKASERYYFFYNDHRCDEVLRVFARYAAEPQLGFSWHDASNLSQKVRKDISNCPNSNIRFD